MKFNKIKISEKVDRSWFRCRFLAYVSCKLFKIQLKFCRILISWQRRILTKFEKTLKYKQKEDKEGTTMSNGSSIISSISSGLSNTYSYLASLYPNDGVTYENITKARNDSTNYLTLNQSFASYLQNNFSTLDKDKDGVIGADEMNKLTNMISTSGVTKAELTQLASSGVSSEMLSKIMENFDEIDKNHDGRVTSEEISSFSYSCTKQEKLDEDNYKKATNMSLFYGEENASEPASYSILSYKYKNFNSK